MIYVEQLQNIEQSADKSCMERNPHSDSDREVIPEKSEDISEVIGEILDKADVPSDEKKQIIQAISRQQYFSGPLPSPKMLAEYNKIPGAVSTILKMAEGEMDHRHQMERDLLALQTEQNKGRLQLISSNIELAKNRQKFGFFISCGLMIVSIIALFRGITGGGIALLLGGFSSFIGVMFYGQKPSDNKGIPNDENDDEADETGNEGS